MCQRTEARVGRPICLAPCTPVKSETFPKIPFFGLSSVCVRSNRVSSPNKMTRSKDRPYIEAKIPKSGRQANLERIKDDIKAPKNGPIRTQNAQILIIRVRSWKKNIS